jgi:hypothetical protein
MLSKLTRLTALSRLAADTFALAHEGAAWHHRASRERVLKRNGIEV